MNVRLFFLVRWMLFFWTLAYLGMPAKADAPADRPMQVFQGDVSIELRPWQTSDADALRSRWDDLPTNQQPDVIRQLLMQHRQSGELVYLDNARVLLDAALVDMPTHPAELITENGAFDAINLAVRDMAYLLALRYQATGNEADATAVRDILLRFAQVVPDWPLRDRQGQLRRQDDQQHFRQWDGRGIWGVWYHMDLEHSFPVLRAYDLIYNTLSESQRQTIRRGLFDHQVSLIANWPMNYSNMIGHLLIGLIEFGLILPEPAYIHQAVKHYDEMTYVSFFPDGFFREATPSYHTMPAGRMESRIPSMLTGYSDPLGYVHPDTGQRFDQLDLAQQYAHHHARWWRAWDVLTLPNRTTLAVNDSTFGRGAWWNKRDLNMATSRLLGATGIGVLGQGSDGEQLETYLLFAGTHGHEHYDVLHLTWWAHGREVFSETNYRPLPGTDSTRRWHTMSAGHNLVVVDEKNQHGRFAGRQRELTEDDAIRGMPTWRWRNRSLNHGQLLLFDPTWDQVQAIEADGRQAYSCTASDYRRTLAMVPLGGGDGYLLDIFRVRGGLQHDYMLHGSLEQTYAVEHDLESKPIEGVAYEYIQLEQAAWVKPPAVFSFVYPDGVRTRTHIASPTAMDGLGEYGLNLMVGSAPAMRRKGHAPFVILRRRGGVELAEPGADNTFVLVHEAIADQPLVETARLLAIESDDPEAVAVAITRTDGRQDIFLSSYTGQGTIRLEDGTTFRGRLGYISTDAQGSQTLRIFDGYQLHNAQGQGIDTAPVRGQVVQTLREETGDPGNGLILDSHLPGDVSVVGCTIHVDMGDAITWSYRITGQAMNDQQQQVVWVEHDPGFEIRDGGQLIKMLFYPGWGNRQPAAFHIALPGHWESSQ